MSVLAHPGPISFTIPRRRHLTVVPALPAITAESEQLADVIALPLAEPVGPRPLVVRPVTTRPVSARPVSARPVSARPASAARAAVAEVPVRLSARGRAVLAGLAVLSAAVVGSVAGITASTPDAAPAVEVVTVASGESLWSIASEVAVPGADVRDVMSEIASLNGLEGTTLVAGQQLTVPSEG